MTAKQKREKQEKRQQIIVSNVKNSITKGNNLKGTLANNSQDF